MIKPKGKSAGLPARIMQENTLNAITQNTSYTVTVEEDGDDLILPIPEELLKELQWNTGDVLEWDLQLDNTIILRKSDERPE